jgi:hypothetical protein
MKKYLILIAIALFSVCTLFAYTVHYRVIGCTDENFTYGYNGETLSGPFTTENYCTINSPDESWSVNVGSGGIPNPWIVLSHYLTRDETGYTVTKAVTENDIFITIRSGGGIPNNPPVWD